MAISISEIEVGYLYKTKNNQERIALELKGNKVTYASRGGNVGNSWRNQRHTSSLATFAKACDKRLSKVKKDEFNKIKKQNNL